MRERRREGEIKGEREGSKGGREEMREISGLIWCYHLGFSVFWNLTQEKLG